MRAIVATVSIGYSPTLVSPDSITASAPSSTALATSEASARVGRGAVIIDSSIWVATMTGLALRRAVSMTCFCRNGTSSSGHSTPRSPRATMNAVEGVDDLVEVVDRLRLLDLGDDREADALLVHDRRGRPRRPSAERTNDSAIMSTVRRSAQRRSSLSFSVSAGTRDGDAGQVDALVVADRAADHDRGAARRCRRRASDLAAAPGRRRSGSGRRPPTSPGSPS